MNKDLQKLILSRYPELYRHQDGYPLAQFGLQIPDGWLDLVSELSADIMAYVKRTGIPTPIVLGIKEKFAMLRVWIDQTNDDLDKMIEQAVSRSNSICEECGAEGTLYERNRRWLHVFCEKHANGCVAVTSAVTAPIE